MNSAQPRDPVALATGLLECLGWGSGGLGWVMSAATWAILRSAEDQLRAAHGVPFGEHDGHPTLFGYGVRLDDGVREIMLELRRPA